MRPRDQAAGGAPGGAGGGPAPVLALEDVRKTYPNGVRALRGVSLEAGRGRFLAVIGLSGSGKSTLLRCANRLVDPTGGRVVFEGRDITGLSGARLRRERSRMGMIFQDFNLVGRRTVLENVLTGALFRTAVVPSILGLYAREDREKARRLVGLMGLADKERVRVDQLSGGQRQRTAIARSLMQDPSLLLADEPVASLDPATSHGVLRHLRRINRELGTTVVCNLHFLSLVREYATDVVALKDGLAVFEGAPGDIDRRLFKDIYGEEAGDVAID